MNLTCTTFPKRLLSLFLAFVMCFTAYTVYVPDALAEDMGLPEETVQDAEVPASDEPVEEEPVAPVEEDAIAPVGEDAIEPVGEDAIEPVEEEAVAPVGVDVIAPASLDTEAASYADAKEYLMQFAGDYYTDRNVGGKDWEIVIADDGEVSLLKDGKDTGAVGTPTMNATNRYLEKIVFSHDDWKTSNGASPQTVTFSWVTSGYFTMPFTTIYGVGKDVIEKFTSNAKMYNHSAARAYFANYAGEYTLNDGSGWAITVSPDGELSLSEGTDGSAPAAKACVDYITFSSDRKTPDKVFFTSEDWYTQTGDSRPWLTLQFSDRISNSYGDFIRYRFQVASDVVLYKQSPAGTVYKAFSSHMVFDGETWVNETAEYFKAYQGKYSLGAGYGEQFERVKDWNIRIDGDGKVWLYQGDRKLTDVCATCENWYTFSRNIGGEEQRIPYVYQIKFFIPGWYTSSSKPYPYALTFIWNLNIVSPAPDNNGEVKNRFTVTNTSGKPYCYDADGNPVYFPDLYFDHETKVTAVAKEYLSAHPGTYTIIDGSGWSITVTEDGSASLTDDKGQTHSAAAYNLKYSTVRNHTQMTGLGSVTFVGKDWFKSGGSLLNLTFSWTTSSESFASGETALYEKSEDGNVSLKRYFNSSVIFSKNENMDKARAYLRNFADDYLLNDGSGSAVRIKSDGSLAIKLVGVTPNDDFVDVGYAPTFKVSNDETVVNTVSFLVAGLYSSSTCSYLASLKLTWCGALATTLNHQFTVSATTFYRSADEVFCLNGGTLYSSIDSRRAMEYMKQFPGTYRPRNCEDAWYVTVGEDGSVLVHTKDANGEPIAISPSFDIANMNSENNTVSKVNSIAASLPGYCSNPANSSLVDTLCARDVKFFFGVSGVSRYFYASDTTLFDRTDADGNPWSVGSYIKTFDCKLYRVDRAYSDADKAQALEYFQAFAGTYCLDSPGSGYRITVAEDGSIVWSDGVHDGQEPADVVFTKTSDGELVPSSIYLSYNGYYTADPKDNDLWYSRSTTQHGEVGWITSGTNRYTFESSASTSLYQDDGSYITTPANKYHYLKGDADVRFDLTEGKYYLSDRSHYIEVKGQDGAQTYMFDGSYPLALLSTEGKPYLRGALGKTTTFYNFTLTPAGLIVVAEKTKITNANGSQTTLAAGDMFALYVEDTHRGNIVVAADGQSIDQGTRYDSLVNALFEAKNGSTVYLTNDVEVASVAEWFGGQTAAADLSGSKKLTIDGQGHTLSRADGYTGTLLKFCENSDVTITNLHIDGKTDWTWKQDVLEKDVEYMKKGLGILDAQAQEAGCGYPVEIPEDAALSTGNVIQFAGTHLTLGGNTGVENFYFNDNSVIGLTGAGVTVDLGQATVRHNIGNGQLLVRGEDSNSKVGLYDVTVNMNSGATYTDNYVNRGTAGMVYLRDGSVLNIYDGAALTKNVAVVCDVIAELSGTSNGKPAMLNIHGGDISENIALDTGSSGNSSLFHVSDGSFHMSGGEIHNNSCSYAGVLYASSGKDAVEFTGGKIYENDEASDRYDFDLSVDAVFGEQFSTDGLIYTDKMSASGSLENKGTVGSLKFYDGADVKNSGIITGDVNIDGNDSKPFKHGTFVNEGTIGGNVNVGHEADFDMNGGVVKGNVTLLSDGNLNLNGGTVEGDVTLSPHATMDPGDTDSIKGTIYVEYTDEADKERVRDYMGSLGFAPDAPNVVYRQHSHTFGEPVETVEATCVDAGEQTVTCNTCREVVKTVLPALGHQMGGWTVTQEFTCTQSEISTNKCANCDYVEYKVTRKNETTEHDYQEDVSARVEPQIGVLGSKTYKCSRCGASYGVVIPALAYGEKAHTWEEDNDKTVLQSATCTKDGSFIEATCTTCQTEIHGVLPATGHRWSDEPEEISKESQTATCSRDGISRKATYCLNETGTNGKARVYNKVMSVEITPKLAHDWRITQNFTKEHCTDRGEIIYTCSKCREKKREIVQPEAHDWQITKDFIKEHCTDEGEIVYTCATCQAEKTEIVPSEEHDWHIVIQEPTCENDGILLKDCRKCGEILSEPIPATGHHPVDDPAVDPTCTTPGKTAGSHCSNCGEVYEAQETIPALGHDFDEGEVIYGPSMRAEGLKRRTCKNCGMVVEEPIEKLPFRCKWCDRYEAHKDIPVIGIFYTIIHFFVHMAHQISL